MQSLKLHGSIVSYDNDVQQYSTDKVIPFRTKKSRDPSKYKGYKTFKEEARDGARGPVDLGSAQTGEERRHTNFESRIGLE